MMTVTIETDYIKLDSFLKYAALAGTGGEAKLMVEQGLISVNGIICHERGKKLHSGDKVLFDGKEYLIEKT